LHRKKNYFRRKKDKREEKKAKEKNHKKKVENQQIIHFDQKYQVQIFARKKKEKRPN